MAMTIGLAGSPAASERLGRAGALRPDRPAPERARPGQPAPGAASVPAELTLPRLARATHFSIHQLLAEAPELGRAPASRPRTLAAYHARLADRIRYFGPIASVDLRV